MENNKIKIITYRFKNGEGRRDKATHIFLNGDEIGYITDYVLTRNEEEIQSITLTLDCQSVELVEANLLQTSDIEKQNKINRLTKMINALKKERENI